MGWPKGKKFSLEHRQKVSEKLKGNQYALGYKHTEEAKRGISEKMKGNRNSSGIVHSEEFCQAISKRMKGNQNASGFHHSKEYCQAISKRMKGNRIASVPRSKEFCQAVSERMKGNQYTLGHTPNEKTREALSKAQTAYLKTPKGQAFLKRFTLAGRRALHGSPSKGEFYLKEILDAIDPGWIHNSAQEEPIWIDGKEPDFIKDHKIIEVFGGYWHKEAEESQRKEAFEQSGYICFVIWYSDLGDVKTLSRRILEFVGGFNEM